MMVAATSSRQGEEQQPRRHVPAESENNLPLAVIARRNSNNNSDKLPARWPLAKYAKLIGNNSQPSTAGAKWQETVGHQQAPNMWIQITQRGYVQILHGDGLLECCTVSEAAKEWRAVQRQASMLFVDVKRERSRQFRIRFLQSEQGDAIETATACARRLSCHIKFIEPDRDGQYRLDSEMRQEQCVGISQLADAVLRPQQFKWPFNQLCADDNLASQPGFSDLVRTCLLDPNFPSLVEAVEKSLKEISLT